MYLYFPDGNRMHADVILHVCAAGGAPWPNGEPGPGDHLRKVFYRMGFTDQEIVALSGESGTPACGLMPFASLVHALR